VNGKLATFFKILGRNVPGIAVVWGFLLSRIWCILLINTYWVHGVRGLAVCSSVYFVAS
jgi:hypothetical protein